jgi:hypothetical protein
MTTTFSDADTLLAVDVGSVNTRAMLFDVVDGHYRFLAAGASSTTADAPFHDVGEGVRLAVGQLEEITGHTLIGKDERLIIPTTADGSGVDMFTATLSAGPPLKIVIIGLLEDISLDSARKLAQSTYSVVVDAFSLSDRRQIDAHIDALLRLRPDIIIVAGGTEGGASQSVLKLLEPVRLVCSLLPEGQRPEILFAGNQTIVNEVEAVIGRTAKVHAVPNIRPALETEQLDAAQTLMADLSSLVRIQQIPGVRELDEWAGGGLLPTSSGFGRVIRFLSKAHASSKGVLGVDVGASSTTIAAAKAGEMTIGVYPHDLNRSKLANIKAWLSIPLADDAVREYLANKALFPACIPVTIEGLAIEQAIARNAIFQAIKRASAGFLPELVSSRPGLLPWFEPIIASGSILTRTPNLGQCALMLLDSLQPVGATTFVLDQNHVASALGAAASINQLLTVQVLDSSAFLHLGTVIAPVGNASPGTPVLRLKMSSDSGHDLSLDIKQGSLEVIPLSLGQTAKLHLQPLHRYDVGMGGPGRSGGLRVMGGALGVIIDARGRPLQLPEDLERRQELYKKWLWTLGA